MNNRLLRVATFAGTVFLSALLLFMVQPLISKYLLPWFGGSASLWATAMVVFQLLLLAGYLYVHLGVRLVNPSTHVGLHILLSLITITIIGYQSWSWGTPLLPPDSWAPTGANAPVYRVFFLLGASIGLPYFLLSTTSPLLQYWFGYVESEDDPYRLYALSNAGSLIGLLGYPLLIEYFLPIPYQGYLWGVLFVVTAIGIIGATYLFRLNIPPGEELFTGDIKFPGWGLGCYWWITATVPSALFLAVTNRLSHVAPVVPFLWVIPLAIYLISLIVCFGRPDHYSRTLYSILWFPAVACVVVTLWYSLQTPFPYHVLILSYALLVGCMIGHGELTSSKPHRRDLTAFYIIMATGGATGGIFVSLVSPWLFNGYWEFHTLLFGGVVGVLVLLAVREDSWLNQLTRWMSVPLITIFFIGIELGLLTHAYSFQSESRYLSRNFYGITRVIDEGYRPGIEPRRIIKHGNTRHGSQLLTPSKQHNPTGYYGKHSGVGRVLSTMQKQTQSMEVGVIGLGAGVMASYGRENDHYRFYEINPDIIELASGADPLFTFLSGCQCTTDVIEGDARLSMEQELRRNGPREYDLLAVDVFQNGSPPAHLLSIEAFDLYRQHVADGGVLAFNVSNRYLNLERLIHRYSRMRNMRSRYIISVQRGVTAQWMLISKNKRYLKGEEYTSAIEETIDSDGVTPWTDQYSNLFGLINWTLNRDNNP